MQPQQLKYLRSRFLTNFYIFRLNTVHFKFSFLHEIKKSYNNLSNFDWKIIFKIRLNNTLRKKLRTKISAKKKKKIENYYNDNMFNILEYTIICEINNLIL